MAKAGPDKFTANWNSAKSGSVGHTKTTRMSIEARYAYLVPIWIVREQIAPTKIFSKVDGDGKYFRVPDPMGMRYQKNLLKSNPPHAPIAERVDPRARILCRSRGGSWVAVSTGATDGWVRFSPVRTTREVGTGRVVERRIFRTLNRGEAAAQILANRSASVRESSPSRSFPVERA